MADWKTVYQTMLDDCCDSGDLLNDWEQEFLDSIFDRLDRNTPLTQRQIETLENIHQKVKRGYR